MEAKDEQLIIHISHDMLKPSAYKKFDGFLNLSKLDTQYDTLNFNSPIKYEITITNTGDALLISGKALAKAETSCSRCLEPVDVNLQATIDAYYLIEAPQTAEEYEINEFEILPDDHNIPLGEIIKATLVVDAPLKPLCQENCKGLCSKCGVNLNKEACRCSDIPDDTNPFSVLKDLKL